MVKKELKKLVKELEELNQRYLELQNESDKTCRTKEDVEETYKKLIQSGELIIDFYNNNFIPNYSNLNNSKISYAKNNLMGFSGLASVFISQKSYFGLSVLLTNKGSKITDPNNLEKLILKLKK